MLEAFLFTLMNAPTYLIQMFHGPLNNLLKNNQWPTSQLDNASRVTCTVLLFLLLMDAPSNASTF
jgi:hypothetical protein